MDELPLPLRNGIPALERLAATSTLLGSFEPDTLGSNPALLLGPNHAGIGRIKT